jgi:putative membrane protein
MLQLLLKGMVLGLSNVIPGISAGTMALVMGIYQKTIEALYALFSTKEKRLISLRFLLPIFTGMGIGILLFSKVLSFLFSLPTFKTLTLIFITGLVLGSIPLLYRLHSDMRFKVSRFAFFVLALLFSHRPFFV